MLGRGLRLPTTVTSDGAPGLVRAIGVCFPASIRIRCWFYRLANIQATLPDEAAAEVTAHVYAVRDGPDPGRRPGRRGPAACIVPRGHSPYASTTRHRQALPTRAGLGHRAGPLGTSRRSACAGDLANRLGSNELPRPSFLGDVWCRTGRGAPSRRDGSQCRSAGACWPGRRWREERGWCPAYVDAWLAVPRPTEP
jgi:hypothetical protein